MKTVSKALSENSAHTILFTAGMISVLIITSIFTSCVKEIGRQNTQEKAIAAQLSAVRMQMGIVENNEHLAR